MHRSFVPGTRTVLVSPGLRPPNKVFFEDDGETGWFYALDLSRPDTAQIVDALFIYNVSGFAGHPKLLSVRIQWSTDGGRAALFLDDRGEAVFDFDRKRGYARSGSLMPAISPWPRSDHAWDDHALDGIR